MLWWINHRQRGSQWLVWYTVTTLIYWHHVRLRLIITSADFGKLVIIIDHLIAWFVLILSWLIALPLLLFSWFDSFSLFGLWSEGGTVKLELFWCNRIVRDVWRDCYQTPSLNNTTFSQVDQTWWWSHSKILLLQLSLPCSLWHRLV